MVAGREIQMGFRGRAAPIRFLEQMRGVCFIIENRSDSPCLCYCVGHGMHIFNKLVVWFCTVILVLSQGKARMFVYCLCINLSISVCTGALLLFVPVSL